MSAVSTKTLAQIFSGPSDEKSASPLWRRLRDGLQETVQRIMTEEPPAPPVTVLPLIDAWNERPVAGRETDDADSERWTLVLSDTDNDFTVVQRCLWLAGWCDRNGCWKPGLKPFRLVHTGDWLNKWNPNPHVLDGFKRLRETLPDNGEMILLNGNHELSILQMAEKGLRTPLTAEDLAFIRDQEVLFAEKGTLYLHGYPGMDLLLALKQLHREEIPTANFNQRLKKLFFEGRYPLFMEPRGLAMIGDVRKPKTFYDRREADGLSLGSRVAGLLRDLGFHTVVHGHKPLTTVQLDNELDKEIPGVRFINNDNRIKQTGLGGLLVNPDGGMLFINPETVRMAGGLKPFRKKLRKRLKTRGKDRHPPGYRKSLKARSVQMAA